MGYYGIDRGNEQNHPYSSERLSDYAPQTMANEVIERTVVAAIGSGKKVLVLVVL